jgi:hypothetical protein
MIHAEAATVSGKISTVSLFVLRVEQVWRILFSKQSFPDTFIP